MHYNIESITSNSILKGLCYFLKICKILFHIKIIWLTILRRPLVACFYFHVGFNKMIFLFIHCYCGISAKSKSFTIPWLTSVFFFSLLYFRQPKVIYYSILRQIKYTLSISIRIKYMLLKPKYPIFAIG